MRERERRKERGDRGKGRNRVGEREKERKRERETLIVANTEQDIAFLTSSGITWYGNHNKQGHTHFYRSLQFERSYTKTL